MGEVLNVPTIGIETDAQGRMRLDDLEEKLKTGKIGTVVVTVGTTGLGAVDPLADILPLARSYGARVHVDTAYGGFFTLIAENHLDSETARHYKAIADSDSVVVDPHKHGLQPYGCGAVLFRDVSVGRFYKHDSPYTYFASEDLHFGEIQLECSRAGASAAALWATLKVFPLSEAGLGQVLLGGRRAAIQWHELIEKSEYLMPLQRPELDILAYLPKFDDMASLDWASHEIFERSAKTERTNQIHLATYVMKPDGFAKRNINLSQNSESARIMRSVLMKPEQEHWIPDLHTHVESLAKQLIEEKR
jgi:glutamate/tyrosine decarboxylase-like PLP-dependent enzyme